MEEQKQRQKRGRWPRRRRRRFDDDVVAYFDAQGFAFNGRFVVKEVAGVLRDVSGLVPTRVYHWRFGPPCRWDALSHREQLAVRWLTRNHHGLAWDDPGHAPYNQARALVRWLLRKVGTVYVKNRHALALAARYCDAWQCVKTMDIVYRSIDASFGDGVERYALGCNAHDRHCALANVVKMCAISSPPRAVR